MFLGCRSCWLRDPGSFHLSTSQARRVLGSSRRAGLRVARRFKTLSPSIGGFTRDEHPASNAHDGRPVSLPPQAIQGSAAYVEGSTKTGYVKG